MESNSPDLLETKSSNLREKLISIRREMRDDPISWSIIIFITAFFGLFMIVPLLQVMFGAFFSNGNFPFSTYQEIFQRQYFFDPSRNADTYFIRIDSSDPNFTAYLLKGPDYGVFLNTIFMGVASTILSLVIGIFTAFLMARVELPGKTLLGGFLLIPLVLPPFVSGIGYMALLGYNGLVNTEILEPLFGIRIVLQGMFAIVFVQSAHYFTLIYLNVYSSLMNADPSLEEAAENMGATRFQVVKNVTLPLALPGIASGSILVLILSMEDLGTPAIFAGFGDLTARKTITYYILSTVRQSLSETGRLPAELSILSAFLLILSIIGFFMIRRYTEKRQYSMISKGRAGTFRTANPNALYLIAIYSYFIILLTLSLIPHIGIFIASLTEPGILPLKWSTSNYQELFDLENGFGSYIKNTMIFSLISTGVIVILATMAGYVANRKQFTGRSAFDTMITIPLAIPGVVLGIGFILLFGGTDAIPFGNIQLTFNPLIYAPIILIISYTIRKFPFTVRAVYAGLQQTDAVLEEAAHNLGASKGRTIYNVIIPLIVLNIVAGALIALVYNMSEVSTTLILVNTQTHGTVTWAMADANGKIGALAAMGMFLMFLQALSLFITNVLLKNRAEAITGI